MNRAEAKEVLLGYHEWLGEQEDIGVPPEYIEETIDDYLDEAGYE